MTTFRFTVDANRLLATLHTIVDSQISSHKSKKAEQNRTFASTCSNAIVHIIPLVNSEEVRVFLKRVETTIAAIHALGIVLGAGSIVTPKDGNEDRFEMPYSDSLERLKPVLEENVQAGLERFLPLVREDSMEEEHISPTGKFFKLNLHKWRR
ncbi:hypothetical protein AGABI2DRAFT_119733 [Agaricus bisporus var. bisporus H97]|uniref:hypothetical protein n=1 Tax=Agaricus bisporus var. bisporus (strain H97 / ATCC MYA-4626 / FGSC 10389) TaxID=936046 RepID=UPI00029F51D4|nr:hypothetical protein AGABI2DRAFT_119733 [Agaricus bisporus var. bisporus H97]EKV46081.1 hypothetical protein AGABI2DRAFT_119733 [Agaricus bisporus var. bisporus H97]